MLVSPAGILSVEETFEEVADRLTPTAEQLRDVEQLREALQRHFDSTKIRPQAIKLLSVVVVDGAPRPLFALVLRGAKFAELLEQTTQAKRGLNSSKAGSFSVDGSPLTFELVVGVLELKTPHINKSFTHPHDMFRLSDRLPSLMEADVGPHAARIGRLVLQAWGEPLETHNVDVVVAAVVAHAATPPVDLASVVRDVLVAASAREVRAVRADHALRLTRDGRLAEAHRHWRALMGAVWPVDAGAVPSRGDVITSIGVRGLRSVESLRLDLRGLTVLIGENGSGKSTLIEACELMRRMASPAFLDELNTIHGGLRALLRHGAREAVFTVELSGADLPLRYGLRLVPEGSGVTISSERLVLGRLEEGGPAVVLIDRDRTRALVPSYKSESIQPPSEGPTLTSFGSNLPHPDIGRMVAALKAIEVHVPFEVTPAWVGRAHGRPSGLRGSVMIQSASGLERLGVNLANAYHALRSDGSEAHWRETMDYVRLGLGERIESVNTRADIAGGAIALWIKLRARDEQIPATSLSEGMLAYLAFVALFRLPSKRSLLVFDEPELHLHPRLLTRVMGFFQALSERGPVLLATHSRRLLDELQDPAGSAVLCELDDADATRLRYPDREALDAWLEDYEGLGRVLDAGYESEVMVPRGEA